jgi:hypothetical protein
MCWSCIIGCDDSLAKTAYSNYVTTLTAAKGRRAEELSAALVAMLANCDEKFLEMDQIGSVDPKIPPEGRNTHMAG